jgi:hypothetical protein
MREVYGYLDETSIRGINNYYANIEQEVRAFIRRTKIPRMYLHLLIQHRPTVDKWTSDAGGSVYFQISGEYKIMSEIPPGFRPNLP